MAIKNKQAVVITGDVIKSSQLATPGRKKLQHLLEQFFSTTAKAYPDFKAEQFRGDSIQAYFTTNRKIALRTALSLQSCLIGNGFSIRLAIGVGEISYTTNNVVTSDGSAFQMSGPLIDELKKRNEHIGVAATATIVNEEWQVHTATLNYLIERWTMQQAEAMYLQLQNLKQEEIAAQLKISQPSVHQRLQAAGWPVISKVLQRFENVIPAL